MEQNVNNEIPVVPETPKVSGVPEAPMASEARVMNNKQSGNGLKIATTIACVVAVCGIGFGVYGIVQSSQKDNKIADLTSQIEDVNKKMAEIDERDTKVEQNTEVVEVGQEVAMGNLQTNPVYYEGGQTVQTYTARSEGGVGEISSTVSNGEATCRLIVREVEEGNIFGRVKSSEECLFTGLEGKVSKVVAGEFGKQAVTNSKFVFLMENGKVYYVDTSNWSNEYRVEEFGADKTVIDVVHLNNNFAVRYNDNTTALIW